jgi:Holliday junction resolvasome RuvABC endonuclease subunit
MFHLKDDGAPYRIVGIDPGTDTVGFAVIDLNLLSGKMDIGDVKTLVGSERLKYYRRRREIHGDRFVRLQLLKESLIDGFMDLQPHAVICESPYFNPRRPGAFYALVEAVNMVQHAVYAYCPDMVLNMIDPAKTKANLGVSGKSGDKEAIGPALARAPYLHGSPRFAALPVWDEHSRDALAIAYYHACTLRSQLFLAG